MIRAYAIVDPSRRVAGCECFWRAASRGYTCDPFEAGTYTEKEAREITERVDDYAVPMSEVLAATIHRVEQGRLKPVNWEDLNDG